MTLNCIHSISVNDKTAYKKKTWLCHDFYLLNATCTQDDVVKLDKILRNRIFTEGKYGESSSCLAVGFEVNSPD